MTPFTCSNCGAPCDCDYLCPGCREPICHRCVFLGNEMKMLKRTFRCAKCKELATKRNEKEASMNKDGGAAFPNVLVTVDKNGSQNFIVNNGMTMRRWYKGMALRDCGYELREYIHKNNYKRIAAACGAIADAMLAEDAEREGKDDRK